MVFDSWNCWNESKPGTTQELPCPNFPHLGFSPSRTFSSNVSTKNQLPVYKHSFTSRWSLAGSANPMILFPFHCLTTWLMITGPSYKTCMDNGQWWRHPETNMTWSNYTQCVNIQDMEVVVFCNNHNSKSGSVPHSFQFRNTVNIISLSGWSLSLFFMAISLFIFFYFK